MFFKRKKKVDDRSHLKIGYHKIDKDIEVNGQFNPLPVFGVWYMHVHLHMWVSSGGQKFVLGVFPCHLIF